MEKHATEEIKEFLWEKEIKLINCKTIDPVFHRYFPLSRLEEMLNDKQLAFVYPKLWNDPYETLYLETDFSPVSNYKQPKIFCLCARSTDDNEEASWKVYSDGREPLIRVRFHVVELLQQIHDFASKNDCNLYYSQISYAHDYDEIKQINIKDDLRKEFLKDFDEEKYIKLMSLKRPSFGYEKEVRLFIVPKKRKWFLLKQKQPLFEKEILKIPIEYNVFERFTLNPLERIREENEMKLYSLIKKAQYESLSEIVECFITSKVPHIKRLHRSVLYKNMEPIEKV